MADVVEGSQEQFYAEVAVGEMEKEPEEIEAEEESILDDLAKQETALEGEAKEVYYKEYSSVNVDVEGEDEVETEEIHEVSEDAEESTEGRKVVSDSQPHGQSETVESEILSTDRRESAVEETEETSMVNREEEATEYQVTEIEEDKHEQTRRYGTFSANSLDDVLSEREYTEEGAKPTEQEAADEEAGARQEPEETEVQEDVQIEVETVPIEEATNDVEYKEVGVEQIAEEVEAVKEPEPELEPEPEPEPEEEKVEETSVEFTFDNAAVQSEAVEKTEALKSSPKYMDAGNYGKAELSAVAKKKVSEKKKEEEAVEEELKPKEETVEELPIEEVAAVAEIDKVYETQKAEEAAEEIVENEEVVQEAKKVKVEAAHEEELPVEKEAERNEEVELSASETEREELEAEKEAVSELRLEEAERAAEAEIVPPAQENEEHVAQATLLLHRKSEVDQKFVATLKPAEDEAEKEAARPQVASEVSRVVPGYREAGERVEASPPREWERKSYAPVEAEPQRERKVVYHPQGWTPPMTSASLATSEGLGGGYTSAATASTYSRPKSYYERVFDNYVRTSAFSKPTWSTSRRRSRSWSAHDYRARRRAQPESYFSTSNDFAMPPPSYQSPTRSTSFTGFMDYYQKKNTEIRRSTSGTNWRSAVERSSSRTSVPSLFSGYTSSYAAGITPNYIRWQDRPYYGVTRSYASYGYSRPTYYYHPVDNGSYDLYKEIRHLKLDMDDMRNLAYSMKAEYSTGGRLRYRLNELENSYRTAQSYIPHYYYPIRGTVDRYLLRIY